MYFDTHTHSLYPLLQSTNSKSLIVSTDLNSDKPNFSDSRVHHAIGIHPWFIGDNNNTSCTKLKELIQQNVYAAVGEIGLDFYQHHKESQYEQMALFECQLKIANEFNLPVSIHARKSLAQVYNSVRKYHNLGFIHGFSGSFEQAQDFINLGFKLGFNGIICHPNAVKYHRLIQQISLEDMVLETDYPYVKGRDEQPILIDEIAICFAKLKKIPLEEVIYQTALNAESIILRKYNAADL